MTRRAIAVPGNVRYAPVDFEHGSLPDALAGAGFDASRGAVFAWLGVVPYLTPEAIDSTLIFIARVAGRHGGVAFDYGIDRALLTPAQQVAFDGLAARVAAAGEPFRTMFQPFALAAHLRGLGFSHVEDAGPETINARYFAGRADGLRVGGMGHIMWAGHT